MDAYVVYSPLLSDDLSCQSIIRGNLLAPKAKFIYPDS